MAIEKRRARSGAEISKTGKRAAGKGAGGGKAKPGSARIPRYEQLPVREGAPAGSAWGVFGDEDQLGTINLMTLPRVRAAARLVRTGRVFALNLPIDIPNPPLFGRGRHQHVINEYGGGGYILDDYLDNFFPQASSQWDALAHVKHPKLGAYNGFADSEITGRGGDKLGIDHIARRGIAGRGVLADVARHYERTGRTIDFTRPTVIPLEDLEATLKAQRTRIKPGDMLMVRIGWTQWYMGLSPEQKAELARETVVPGIEGTRRTARWLWNAGVAAIASDSPALEPLPVQSRDFLHFHLLAFFGMPIGEMWNLDPLADDCAADKRYEFFFTSAPLNIPGGVGSPPNALAIK